VHAVVIIMIMIIIIIRLGFYQLAARGSNITSFKSAARTDGTNIT